MSQPSPPESVEPEPEPAPVRHWGGGDVVLGLLASLSLTLLVQVAYFSVVDGEAGDEPNLAYVLLNFLGLWIGWLGIVFLASKIKGTGSLRKDFGVGIVWRKDVPMGIALGVAAPLMTFVIYLPLEIFAPDVADKVSDPAQDLTGIASGLGLIPLGIVLCLGAPIAEEIFYRGLALRAFVNRWGRWVGICGSSALFAVVHYNPENLPLQLPALFALAVVLAWISLRNGRLGAAIVAHAVFNSISFGFLVL